MTKWLMMALWLPLAALGAAPPAVEQHHDWGNLKTVYQYGQYYVAGAPDNAAIQRFKDESGGAVVDLRSLKELDCGSRVAATQAGVAYQSIPLDAKAGLPEDAVAQAEASLDHNPPGVPVLVACQTGNRAAAIVAIHAARSEHLTVAQTLDLARSLGLHSKEMRAKLKRYLTAHPSG